MEKSRVKVVNIPVHRQRIASNMPPNMNKKRVCAYCRVSTDEEGQASSYELQVKHYTEFIKSNLNWEFAGVYADYGKSGTNADKRADFMRMIDDCKKGKVNMIITKSISRFARNTLDCINYVRELKGIVPPVGIYFEKEKLDTLDPKNELLLTILSSLAQEEARSISENLKWSIQKRFEAGKARCPTIFLLGYDKDENGNLVINEEEAKTVRRVYRAYMEGKGTKLIAQELKAEGVTSGRGGANWGKSSIIHMLKNERYCGDVLMQKNYTVDFLTHKQRENKGQLPKYYVENHHPAIIPRDEWNAVQDEIKRRHEIATIKDPSIRQGYSNVSVMSNRLFCGHCGQPVIRHMATLTGGGIKEKVPVWRCRATSAKSRMKAGCEICYAKRQQEPKLKVAFVEMLAKLKENKLELVPNESNDNLIKILDKILDSLEESPEFKDEYFRELVEQGTVYNDGRVEYTFKNGATCTSYVKKDRRCRTIKS